MKSFKQFLNKKTMSPEQIAKKHDVPLSKVKKQIRMGTKVEKEHTKSSSIAKEITKDHLGELPDYYTRLKKVEKKK